MANSPTGQGLRLIWRQPSLAFAELAWRWTFAVAVWFLVSFLLLAYMDSLPVSDADAFLLRSGVPPLVWATVRHVLGDSGSRFAGAAVIVAAAVGVLWIVAASAGRWATVRVLLDHFRGEQERGRPMPSAEDLHGSAEITSRWRSARALLGVHFLRAGLLTAAILAGMGAVIVSGFASSRRDPRPELVFLLFCGLILVIAVLWKIFDWLLSIAPIFAVRERQTTFESFCAALGFVREQIGAVAGASALFAVLHFFIFSAVAALAFVTIFLVALVPGWIVATSFVLLSLVYFASIDFLGVARLASYICILEQAGKRDQGSARDRAPILPRPDPADEDAILSDLPGLVPPPEPA